MGYRGGEANGRAHASESHEKCSGIMRENEGPYRVPLSPPSPLPVSHCWESFPTHNALGWACKLISRMVASRHPMLDNIETPWYTAWNGKWVDQGEKGTEEDDIPIARLLVWIRKSGSEITLYSLFLSLSRGSRSFNFFLRVRARV